MIGKSNLVRTAGRLILSLSFYYIASAQIDSVRQTRFLLVRAEEVSDRSALLYAYIAYPSPTSIGWFEWGDSAIFGHTTPRIGFHRDDGNDFIMFELTDLSPVDTIYVRAHLENSAGQLQSYDIHFITHKKMSFGGVSIISVSEITSRSAVIHAELETEHAESLYVSFRYARSGWMQHSFGAGKQAFPVGHVRINQRVTGFLPATKYQLRLIVSSPEGWAYSSPIAITTLGDSTEHGFVLPLSLSSGEGELRVRLWGVHTLATNCTDEEFDEMFLPPPPPGPVFDPRFAYNSSSMKECYDLGLYADVRKYTLPTQIDTYKLKFATESEYYPIRVTWPPLDEYYDGPVTLMAFPDTIDMKKQNSYLITNDFVTTLKIYSSSPTEFGKLKSHVGKVPPSGGKIEYSFDQNYPNPFNPTTLIRFSLTEQTRVTITISNILGEEIATLLDEVRNAGGGSIKWDASNVPAGIYFYSIRAGAFYGVRKMVVVK